MARALREDFVRAGLLLLRDRGEAALTVDAVCAAMGKTKGSFYHHFSDFQAFEAALLDAWVEALTGAPIEASAAGRDATGRSKALDQAVRGLDHQLDRAVRGWALREPRAAEALRRVDARRLDALEALHRAHGHHQPRALAELEYAAFVGAQQLGWIGPEPHRVERLLRRALALLGAPGEPPPTARREAARRPR